MRGKLSQAASLAARQLRLLRRHLRYGPPGWKRFGQAARNEALVSLFRVVNTHLRTLGGDYWIIYGTLLGWQREGRILAHDADVDFGLPAARHREIWESRHLLPPDYTLRDTSAFHGGPKLCVEHRGWEADLYFFQEERGQLRVHIRSDIVSDRLPFPRDWFFPPAGIVFHGEPTCAPARPVAYLEHVYGYIGPDAVKDPATGYFHPRRPAP
jgi:hypothetical protein